jgi:hypothetical protein
VKLDAAGVGGAAAAVEIVPAYLLRLSEVEVLEDYEDVKFVVFLVFRRMKEGCRGKARSYIVRCSQSSKMTDLGRLWVKVKGLLVVTSPREISIL